MAEIVRRMLVAIMEGQHLLRLAEAQGEELPVLLVMLIMLAVLVVSLEKSLTGILVLGKVAVVLLGVLLAEAQVLMPRFLIRVGLAAAVIMLVRAGQAVLDLEAAEAAEAGVPATAITPVLAAMVATDTL